MSTAMLVGPLGIVYLFSLLSFRLPGVWCSSDAPGTPMKPAVFYTVEDIAAVDFMHGRDYRTAIHERRVTSSFVHYRNLMFIGQMARIPAFSKYDVTSHVILGPVHAALHWHHSSRHLGRSV